MNTKPSTTNRGCVVGVVLLFSMLIWSVLPIDVRAQQSQTSIRSRIKPTSTPITAPMARPFGVLAVMWLWR